MSIDYYKALISGTPAKNEVLALAAQLRNKQALGAVGALTGDRAVAPVGQQLMGQVANEAGQFQDIRQKDAQRSMLQGYYDQQGRHQDAMLKETIRRNNMLDARAQEGNALRLALAQAKGGRKLGYSDRKRLEEAANFNYGLKNVVSGFKDEYGGQGYGVRPLKNWAAANMPALTSRETEDAAKWWAEYDLLYTLPERNEKFGATLTEPEKEAWKQANISPNMDARQIRERLNVLQTIYGRAMQQMAGGYIMSGFDPDEISYLADTDGEFTMGDDTSDEELEMLLQQAQELGINVEGLMK